MQGLKLKKRCGTCTPKKNKNRLVLSKINNENSKFIFLNKMKRYNYKTKKIYESVSVFSLSLDEFDANGELIDSKDFEDTYSTLEDAIEDAYDIMTNIAENDNIDEDDVAYDENGNTVTFTIDGVGTWVFTVESSQNEYGYSASDSDENEYYDD